MKLFPERNFSKKFTTQENFRTHWEWDHQSKWVYFVIHDKMILWKLFTLDFNIMFRSLVLVTMLLVLTFINTLWYNVFRTKYIILNEIVSHWLSLHLITWSELKHQNNEIQIGSDGSIRLYLSILWYVIEIRNMSFSGSTILSLICDLSFHKQHYTSDFSANPHHKWKCTTKNFATFLI